MASPFVSRFAPPGRKALGLETTKVALSPRLFDSMTLCFVHLFGVFLSTEQLTLAEHSEWTSVLRRPEFAECEWAWDVLLRTSS
jgi:hypothetical protein